MGSLTRAVASLTIEYDRPFDIWANMLQGLDPNVVSNSYYTFLYWSLIHPLTQTNTLGRESSPNVLWLAGGALRDFSCNKTPTDYDIWTTLPWETAVLPHLEREGWSHLANHIYNDEHQVHKMVKWLRRWDLLKVDVVYGPKTPEETILGFDFTVNAVAWDVYARQLIYHADWKEDLAARRLVRVDPGNEKMFIAQERLDRLHAKGFT